MSNAGARILQIMPAGGWVVEMQDPEASPTLSEHPLVGWALAEHGGRTFGAGLVLEHGAQTATFADADVRFKQYLYRG